MWLKGVRKEVLKVEMSIEKHSQSSVWRSFPKVSKQRSESWAPHSLSNEAVLKWRFGILVFHVVSRARQPRENRAATRKLQVLE